MVSAPRKSPRQISLAVLARARRDEIAALLDTAGSRPAYTVLKPAETGTVMVEGRAGGTGRRFNLGEATVTRCVIRLPDGTIGFSYALGRDTAKAQDAAVVDALLQQEAGQGPLRDAVEALALRQEAARIEASRKAAATKVEFFTMVRGEG